MPSVNPLTPNNENKVTKATLQNLMQVLGDSGTHRYSGMFYEEYSNEFRGTKRIDTIEKMRRGDGAIRGLLTAIKSPILRSEWSVESEDTTPKGEEIRAFVEKCLFGMHRTWKDFLREALAYLDFGFYTFELIWEKRDGRIVLIDLAPRIPASIERWKLKDGRFGIVQRLLTDEVKQYEVEIPAEKLLLLTNEKEGDDVTGQSILRAAHKHWYYKNGLYSIASIAAERYGVGVPIVTLPENSGDSEREQAQEMVQNISSNERSFAVLPHGFTFEIKTPSGNPQGQAIEQQIQHHNVQILMSVLATFLSLGSGDSGSFALSRDQSSFFLNICTDLIKYVEEQIEKQVIRRIVDLNFGVQEIYPELHHTPLGEVDYQEFSSTLSSLVGANLLDVTPDIKQHIHSIFNLPPIPQDRMESLAESEIESELSRLESDGEDDGMELPEEEPELDEEEPLDEE